MSTLNKIITSCVLALFAVLPVQAQCAMCRAALEAGGDTKQAEAVNDGIVYLMVIPYVLVGIVAIAIYRSRKKIKSNS